jgi:hypothetical protein
LVRQCVNRKRHENYHMEEDGDHLDNESDGCEKGPNIVRPQSSSTLVQPGKFESGNIGRARISRTYIVWLQRQKNCMWQM